jgi:lysozyme family protein
MIKPTDEIWKKYSRFVLGWEGKGSNDPRDYAAKYRKPGEIHTMRGIIWPTFQANAKAIGVQPTYANFLKLTQEQADLILYEFYKWIKGPQLKDSIGLTMTEFTWGSGPGNSIPALRKAVRSFPGITNIDKTGGMTKELIAAANSINEKALYNKLWADRKLYLERIVQRDPVQKAYIDGWLNRWRDFQKKFPNTTKAVAVGIGLVPLGIGIFFLVRYLNKRNAKP